MLGVGDMSFHVIIEEGPSEEVLAHTDDIENVNSGSNVYVNLGQTSWTYFEESISEPSSVQFSITATANIQILPLSQILPLGNILPFCQILPPSQIQSHSHILPLS